MFLNILADAEMEHSGAGQEQFEDADKWHHWYYHITWQHFPITQDHTEDILSIKIDGRLICDARLHFASNILGSDPWRVETA